jgi:hypothetical protein
MMGLCSRLMVRPGVNSFTVHGSLSAQSAGIDGIITPPQSLVFNLSDYEKLRDRSTEVPKQIEAFLKANAIWVEMHLANLNAGPFNDSYTVTVTDLEMPKGIDLEAASSP